MEIDVLGAQIAEARGDLAAAQRLLDSAVAAERALTGSTRAGGGDGAFLALAGYMPVGAMSAGHRVHFGMASRLSANRAAQIGVKHA